MHLILILNPLKVSNMIRLYSMERKFLFHRKICLNLIGLLRKGMPKTVYLKLFFYSYLPTVHVHPVVVLRMLCLFTQAHVAAVTVTYFNDPLYSLKSNIDRRVLGSIPERLGVCIDQLWPFFTNLPEIFPRAFLFS
jgi:hypothetical protein